MTQGQRWVLILLLFIASLASAAWWWTRRDEKGGCGVSAVAAAKGSLLEVRRRYDDAERLASATSRMSLAGPVAAIQAARRDVDAVPVPPCLTRARWLLGEGMEQSVTSYEWFLHQQEGMATFSRHMATAYVDEADAAIAAAEGCAPNCEALTGWTPAYAEAERRRAKEAAAKAIAEGG